MKLLWCIWDNGDAVAPIATRSVQIRAVDLAAVRASVHLLLPAPPTAAQAHKDWVALDGACPYTGAPYTGAVSGTFPPGVTAEAVAAALVGAGAA